MAKIASPSFKRPSEQNQERNSVLPSGSPNPQARELKEEEVRELAFRLYVNRGRVDGKALEDWLEAEKILRSKGTAAA